MKITARQLNYLITIIYHTLVHHYHGYVSILSEWITSEDQRYWSYYKEVYAVLYDHGVALVVYGIVILTECEVFSKSSVDHHCVWRWDPILQCWRRYTYTYIYLSIFVMISNDTRCSEPIHMFVDTMSCPLWELFSFGIFVFQSCLIIEKVAS